MGWQLAPLPPPFQDVLDTQRNRRYLSSMVGRCPGAESHGDRHQFANERLLPQRKSGRERRSERLRYPRLGSRADLCHQPRLVISMFFRESLILGLVALSACGSERSEPTTTNNGGPSNAWYEQQWNYASTAEMKAA